MAITTKTLTATGSAYYPVTYTANITAPTGQIAVTGASFNVSSLAPTSVTAKMKTSTGWIKYGNVRIILTQKFGNGEMYSEEIKVYDDQGTYWWQQAWSDGETKTLGRVSIIWPSSGVLNTSTYFNSSNKSARSVSLTGYSISLICESHDSQDATSDTAYLSTTVNFSQSLVLDVPPTFTASDVSFNTAYIYSGLTTASVTVSNATAYYGGDIASATLTIGSQTATISGNGTLSIALANAGTFTPTVTVTDSRGQTTTKSLPSITVNGYATPSVLFDLNRTTSAGIPEDEGTYGTVAATFTFTDVVADLDTPTVTLTDANGTTSTPSVTWYSTRASNGELSGSVTWANLSSGDTAYCLIPNLDTNYSYQITITPRDNKGTGTAITGTLPGAFYTIDFLAGGHGIAFGQPASQIGFWCAMDMYLRGVRVPTIFIDTATPTSTDGANGDVWVVYTP